MQIDRSKLTPMMKQYLAIKDEYKDCILFFRLGDFYEMFFDDAIRASKELEITLTGKDCGLDERAPMCGVPHHSADSYISKLIAKGYKVAIGEQVEDPATAKGIVKREVVKVITPGTNLDLDTSDTTSNNYMMSIIKYKFIYGSSYLDISTGEFKVTSSKSWTSISDEFFKVSPVELIVNEGVEDRLIEDLLTIKPAYLTKMDKHYLDIDAMGNFLKEHFKDSPQYTIDNLSQERILAAACLLKYCSEMQKSRQSQFTSLIAYDSNEFMQLDRSTNRNLELIYTLREKERRGSLMWVLDQTKTAMGGRKLRLSIEEPLIDYKMINKRLDAVEELYENPIIREEIREFLDPVYDLERLMTKIVSATANPRDMVSFKQSIAMLPHISKITSKLKSQLFIEIKDKMDTLDDVYDLIDRGIMDEPPISLKDGHVIKDGFNADIDRLRQAASNGKEWLQKIEKEEREKTGIKNLRIKFNRVFGYYLEVTNSYKDLVPKTYIRKQTLTNCERYITPELKELEDTILGAEEKLLRLESLSYSDIRQFCAGHVKRVRQVAENIAMLDFIQSLSLVAYKNNYVKPSMDRSGRIEIIDGRHPVIEKILNDNEFIANSSYLDCNEQRLSIITGPNMAGKSTYMRQVALITLMAQIGSFVPASSAKISIVDRIFTRVGASDDLASGKSTFMVEMTEVANILKNATENSLIILDEIGRGTSTFDGLSIAWAVVEYLTDKASVGAKTLFATHYHELTELEGKLEGVVNYCIAVKEKGDEIIFLRKIIAGGADKSYGIQVAQLAGLPAQVIARAKIILKELTEADITKKRKNIKIEAKESKQTQISLFDRESELIEDIKKLDIDSMSAKDALIYLYDLHERIIKDKSI